MRKRLLVFCCPKGEALWKTGRGLYSESAEFKRQAEERRKEINQSNALLDPPSDLNDDERRVWKEIATLIVSCTNYKKTAADAELLRQYCQTKIMRDRAWAEYNKNPERYMRIVTGLCADGKTPKVLVKENEHYKTLTDCNKQLEKFLKHFMLTPGTRSKR